MVANLIRGLRRARIMRDEQALGLIATIILGIVGLAAVLAAVGATLYATDFPVEATIIDKSCASSGGGGGIFPAAARSSVTIRTKLFGIEHTLTEFDDNQCRALRAGEDGNFVVYHIQSERTILYEREGGSCIYDSATGLGC